MTALALLGPLTLPGAAAGSHSLSLPSAASVRSAVVRLADFVTGHQAPPLSTPVQQTGASTGTVHQVPAAVTRAVANATGRPPGTGRGQLPLYSPHAPERKVFTTGPAPGTDGYDAKTSVVDAAGSTATSVLYKNADGSYSRKVFPNPVNYRTQSGAWAPISTQLDAGPGGRWKDRANSLSVSFAAAANDGSLASVAGTGRGGSAFSVSLGLAGAAAVKGSANGASVRYAGVLQDTDLTASDTATGVAEDLVLKSASAPSSWVFPLTLSGVTARAEPDGSVDLVDSSGAVAGVIPEGLARDSAPAAVPGAGPDNGASVPVPWQVVTLNGGTALAGSVPAGWLSDPSRVFPVTVDPQYNAYVSGSTYVMYPYTNDYSQGAFLKVGNDGSGDYARSFLAFSGLGTSLQNEHITAATLHIFDAWAWTCSTAEPFEADQITASWSVTGSKSWPGPAIGTQMGTSDTTAPSSACTNTAGDPTVGGWMKVPMSAAGLSVLNDWTLNPSHDHGIAVSASTTDDTQWKQFDSFNTVNDPYLWISYSSDVQPQIDGQYPPDNYSSPALTPELIASGSDADNWPDPLQYDFTVYSSSGTQIASSGLISSMSWTVPKGDLAWGQTYYWTVQDYDGLDYSATSPVSYFSTPVPQPLVTPGLSQNASAAGYSPTSGNWTTSATDARVATVGPALEVKRDYNSSDPRRDGAFGTGWSSVLDAGVAPGQTDSSGTTATEVVTYPDGQQVAFGVNPDGSYAPPPGRYAQLASVSGGFTLTDKNDTVYKFTKSLGSGAYGITSIADAFGNTETFSYNASGEVTAITAASGRTLTVTWTTPSGAAYAHVSQVSTQDATAGNSSTAEIWGYSYSADSLAQVCPPVSTTACTKYTYTSGSDYPESVLGSGPHSYWRLDESSGTSAASSVLVNEGADNATYTNVTLASAAGPLAGSSAQSPHFTGSSQVQLPGSLVNHAAYMSVSLWFKTVSTGDGVLFSYQADPLSASTTTKGYTPSIYLGPDGILHGQFWDNSLSPMTSPSPVNDGKWHLVTMTATGNSQVLYLDGVQIGTKSGTITVTGQEYDYLGAGFIGGSWPDESHYQQSGSQGYASYFSGYLSDGALWDRPLTPGEVAAMYAAGTHAAALATQVTRPSGKTYETAAYDPLTGRVTSVTDPKGASWGIGAPAVFGSSQVYRSAVLGSDPVDYWRFNDSGTTNPVNQIIGGTAVNSTVTEGVAGPFSDSTAYDFNTSTSPSSYVALPVGLVRGATESVSLWFKTSTPGGVLLSSSADPITNSTTPGNYTPELYIGQGGGLNAEFYDGTTPMLTSEKVDDGNWHNVVLSAGTNSERLYLDGKLEGSLSSAVSLPSGQVYDYIGAGFLGGPWPYTPNSGTDPTGYRTYFTGQIGEVSFYYNYVGIDRTTAMWNAAGNSTGLVPFGKVFVTDPGGNSIKYTYDPSQGDRFLSKTDGLGNRTTYGYDIRGFLNTTVRPRGDTTVTGHDVRGNVVSETTCQDQVADKCSTSYYTYYPDDTSTSLTPDPRNDVLWTSRDPRSASSSDTTYETSYTYNSLGELTAKTTPAVAGFPSGRTTSYLYTDGTTTAGGYNGAIPPKGLPYQATAPGDAVTTTLYDAAGDVAQVTDPDGLVTRYAYDGLGRLISKTVISDTFPVGLTTAYEYDKDGRVTLETDPPVMDRVTSTTHTAQIATQYDDDGDVTSRTTADLTGTDTSRLVTSIYDSHDLLQSRTDAAGATTSYTYDSYGRVLSKTGPDTNVTDYTYDADGNLLKTELENYAGTMSGNCQTAGTSLVESSRSYDPDGRLASVTDSMCNVTTYGYTDNDLLTSVIRSDGASASYTVQANTYDPAGNLTQRVTNNGKTTTDYTVDAADRVTSQVLDPAGLDRTTGISYTPNDRQSTVTQSGPDGTTRVTSYTYDPGGHMTSQSLYADGSGHPTGWWKLSQTSGTTVQDSSGTGNTASVSGVTWTGGAASFSGTSGQGIATNGPVLDTTGSFSVSAWVNLPSAPSSNEAVVTQAGTNVASFWLLYSAGKGQWEFDVHSADSTSGTVYGVYGSPSGSLTGTWTHLVGVYNAGTSSETLYVDGTAAATLSGVSAFSAGGPLQIGEGLYGGSAGSYLNGSVDNVQVYPRVLSAPEVSTLYNAGRSSGTTATSSELTTKWALDERGLPVSMTDPRQNVTGYTYDEAGRLAQTVEPPVTAEVYDPATGTTTPVTANPVTTVGYDTFGDKAETQNPNGNVTGYTYDGDGRTLSKTLPAYTPPGSSTAIVPTYKWTYWGRGMVKTAQDALQHTATYDYDQLGDLTTVTVPVDAADNAVTHYSYDSNGELLSETGPTGAQTQTEYDFLGRKKDTTQIERYNSTGSAQAYKTNYTYGVGGWLSEATTAEGVSTNYTYDPAGETTSVTDGATNLTKYSYDSLGRQVAVTYPDNSSRVTGYDALGDVTSVQNLDYPSGTVLTSVSATYDATGNQLSVTDARGHTTTFTYDATGKLTQEVQPVSSSASITTSFGYDAAGNQTRYTDGKTNNWYYTYNPWGLQESRVEPATSQYTSASDSTFTAAYNADGLPATVTAPGGAAVTDSYNYSGWLTGQSGTGADAVTATRSLSYDTAGDLTSAATGNTAPSGQASNATSESFTFNDRGEVLTATGTAGSTSYTYNGDGQVASVADAAGTTGYTYDTAGRLWTLADPATGTTATYSYNQLSQVKQISYGTADSQALLYDSLHRLSSDTLQTPSGATVASVAYQYNNNGQITRLDTTGLAAAAANTYTYDWAGRLSSWDNGTATTNYGYDATGNLTQDGLKAYSYDARDQLTSDGTNSYSYTARGTLASEVTPGGTVTSSFDAYGNQATAGTQSYTYDTLGRMTAAVNTSTQAGNAFSYAGATGTIASDGTSAYSWDPSGSVLAGIGVPGGGTSGVLAFTDSHGDVVGQFTASATAVSGSAGYDPWGMVTGTTGSLSGLLGFQSGWTDPVTSKVAMGARWYNPAAGGFTSADTLQVSPVPNVAAANPFAYVGDSPLSASDPTGHLLKNDDVGGAPIGLPPGYADAAPPEEAGAPGDSVPNSQPCQDEAICHGSYTPVPPRDAYEHGMRTSQDPYQDRWRTAGQSDSSGSYPAPDPYQHGWRRVSQSGSYPAQDPYQHGWDTVTSSDTGSSGYTTQFPVYHRAPVVYQNHAAQAQGKLSVLEHITGLPAATSPSASSGGTSSAGNTPGGSGVTVGAGTSQTSPGGSGSNIGGGGNPPAGNGACDPGSQGPGNNNSGNGPGAGSSLGQQLDSAQIWLGRRLPLRDGPSGGFLVKRTPSGDITNYSQYDNAGNIIKRIDLVGRPHAGIPTPHAVDYFCDENPSGGLFPRALPVRPTTPEELP